MIDWTRESNNSMVVDNDEWWTFPRSFAATFKEIWYFSFIMQIRSPSFSLSIYFFGDTTNRLVDPMMLKSFFRILIFSILVWTSFRLSKNFLINKQCKNLFFLLFFLDTPSLRQRQIDYWLFIQTLRQAFFVLSMNFSWSSLLTRADAFFSYQN